TLTPLSLHDALPISLLGLKFFERRVVSALNTTIRTDEENTRGLDAFFRGIGPDLRLEQILKIIQQELEREPQITMSALLDRHPRSEEHTSELQSLAY